MKYSAIITTILAIGAGFLIAQEAYDLNPHGKGVISEEEAAKIDRGWHFPIKLTVKVIDEEGEPVEGANVNVGIDSRLHMDGYNNYNGVSGEDGTFTVESRGSGSSEIRVTKEGYYRSDPEMRWPGDLNNDMEKMKEIGFRPWNPTVSVILKKIGDPIPMIVRLGLSSTDYIHYAPKLGEEVGYDLIAGDWVPPHGGGEVADVQVVFESDFKSPENYTTKALFRFSNPDDGLIPIHSLSGGESLLKYPRLAPVEGYEIKSLRLEKESRESPKLSDKEPIGYFLRIRTIKEKNTGKILSAKYGKIINESGQSTSQNPLRLVSAMWKERKLDTTPGFQISYYLNPTPNDRNLEYDQQNNLAPEADKGATYPP